MTMKSTNYLLAVSVMLSMCACSSTQWVGKSSDLYSVTQGPEGTVTDNITQHSAEPCTKATVVVTDEKVKVKVDPKDVANIDGDSTINAGDGAGKEFTKPNHYIFPEERWTGTSKDHFRYTEAQFYLQPVTVALRFRGAVDTIPGTTEAGFNVGLSYGYKINSVRWSETKNALNSHTSRIGAAGGLLASIGAAELSSANTSGDAFTVSRKLPVLSLGVVLALSLNGFDMGVAGGVDQAIGGHTDDWNYQSKLWWGLVLGLAIFK